jgi:tryptophanyl-tRNA synthetase
LIDVLNTFLEPIRARRAQYAQDPQAVMDVLLAGSAAVREIAAETMDEVRQAMHLDYK